MTMEIRNPAKLPTDLNRAEEYFVRCLAEGKPCIIGDGELPKKDIESGKDANVVRGEVIRFFAYGGDKEHFVRGTIIELRGAWICGKESLDLMHANIPYALCFFRCHFAIGVDIRHAECVALNLSGSRLVRGLEGDGLMTKGSVYLRKGFSAEGEVRLVSANIGKNFSCIGGKFHNPNKCALTVAGSNIKGGLFWRQTTCKGNVHLEYARADAFADDSNSWKSCKVVLDGFTYNRFVGPVDFRSCIEWLSKRPDEISFSPQPYEQAAKVLFRMGYVRDAREILLEKERLQTQDGKMHLQWKIVRQLWYLFSGYGYRLRYTAAWMLGIVVVGTVIFGVADRYSNIVPTHPIVALSEDYKRKIAPNCGLRPTQAVPSEYPAFNPLMFSVDVFTPSAVFHQEDSWGPRSGGGDWLDFDFDILWLLTLWYWLEVAMGWILTSLFLLSVTGLLRPRQSSGEKD